MNEYTAASEGMLLTEQDLTCGRQLLLSVEVLVQLGRGDPVFTSRIGKRAIQLHDRTHLEKRQIQRHDIIKGEARLLGTLARSGKIVDYYRIDDGETVSYVFNERVDKGAAED